MISERCVFVIVACKNCFTKIKVTDYVHRRKSSNIRTDSTVFLLFQFVHDFESIPGRPRENAKACGRCCLFALLGIEGDV